MKLFTIGLALLMVLGPLSCAKDAPPGEQGAKLTFKPKEGQAGAVEAIAAPVIPKGAQYTVYCGTAVGPDHVARAKKLRADLVQSTKMADWFLVQGEAQTTLYYGYYREIDEQVDMNEGTRAQNDRRKVASLLAANGERLFNGVLLVALDTADPTAPAEWNLENARGAYTLEIAAYTDPAHRKQDAVEVVKSARAQGYEAYYFHGPNASLVCIGAWPETAVNEPTEVRAQNPHEVVVVMPGSLPTPERMVTRDGRPVRVVATRYEVMEPKLLAAMKEFPTYSVNGYERRHKVKDQAGGKEVAVSEPSVLKRIPQRATMSRTPLPISPAGVLGPAGPSVGAKAPPPKPPPPTPKPPQGGKLRSIEE
jgi:hypothetical protein